MYKKYVARLTEEERSQRQTLLRRGRTYARKLLYARILLKADANGADHWTDEKITDAFAVSTATVARERRRFARRDWRWLVLYSLSTHTGAAFYESFPSEQARLLARKVEFCYTPVYGSWLTMAEIGICALVRQCLKRRLADEERLGRDTKALEKERNRLGASVDWHFRTEDAGTNIRNLYTAE